VEEGGGGALCAFGGVFCEFYCVSFEVNSVD
jgi:hypothetical protein